ncbi:MAG: hypothetical protein K2N28_02610 [Muribaculaceae bacterium]|nr:hypothetical protein [Muribaculaceae bacterium]
MESKSKILCIVLLSVFMASYTTVLGAEKSQYTLSVSAIDADSVVLKLCNDTSEPAYLFDSYLNEYDIDDVSYIHRYNRKDGVVKVSFLPFQQYLEIPSRIKPGRKMIVGEKRYLVSGQILYRFTKVAPGDSLTIRLSKKTLTTDRYYRDVNLREYTHVDEDDNPKKALKLKRSRRIPRFDEITIELAVYKDIDYFLENELSKTLNYKYIRFPYYPESLDAVASAYDIVTCRINLKDL